VDPTLPTALDTHEREPNLLSKASFPPGPGSVQREGTQETDAQEDWLSLAPADPTFWLKSGDQPRGRADRTTAALNPARSP